MKENYWVREELDDESFRRELTKQDRRHSISQHPEEHGQDTGKKRWHKQNRTRSPTSVAPKTNGGTNNVTVGINTNISLGCADDLNRDVDRGGDILNGDKDLGSLRIAGDTNTSEFRADECLEDKSSRIQSAPLEYKERLQVRGQHQSIKKEENEVNLSFCGCGFLGIYHVGVASCFHQYAPQLSMHKIAGSSAGALVAVAHICGNLQLAYATTDILRVAIDARARALGPLHPSFDINAIVREALERGLPDDVHLRASGKLHISLTRVYDGENVVVSEFESKEDVIQALLCSCFIPFWSGLVVPKYKGVSYMDGGFSKNLLILDEKTVTVSPFAGETDICPQDDSLNLLQVSISSTSFSLSPNNLYRLSHALLPPPPEVLSDLCEQGFADGIRFLQRMKLISCTKCLEIRSSLLVTVNGEDMEEAFTQQVNSDDSMKSTSSFSENHHIRLEQQEQKMIEINGSGQRRNSVVSTTSQVYQQQAAASVAASHTTNNPISYHRYGEINKFSPISVVDPIDDMETSCNECYLMRQKALCEPLPTQFSDRIRDACDAVNKSLSNWFYSYRPIKYLSYLATPYYLPIDISLALILKCWQELPLIRSELLNCVSNIVNFLIGILRRMHLRSTSSILRKLMRPDSSWEEKERYAIEVNQKAESSDPIGNNASDYDKNNNNSGENDNTNNNGPPCCPQRNAIRHQENCITQDETLPITTPTTTSTNILPETIESSPLLTGKITPDSRSPQVSISNNPQLGHHSQHQQLHSLEDTFDSIVDVTSNQEARIFAYYFRDAKNRLQVTEIFDLERVAELNQSLPPINGGNAV